MGYLNNQVVTVDAILTTKGRELLAKNDGSFRITQFALADDEIDYTLYNPENTSGSAYYGEAISNMPLLEAFPKESQIMKYKLATLPRGTAVLPVIALANSSISLKQGQTTVIEPQTLNYLGNASAFETSGYSATIADVRTMATFNGTGIQSTAAEAQNASSTTTLGTNVSSTVIGSQINLRATTINTLFESNTTINTTITIVGLDSGARITVPVTITQTTTS
jgi:hypothetical protein